jgi:hypothetical protein
MLIPNRILPSKAIISAVYSYGLLNVSAVGTVSISGSLADGTPINRSSSVSENGMWPLYVPLYGGRGVIMGWLGFSGPWNYTLSGTLTWIKPSMPQALFYKNGFTNTSGGISGSMFRPVPAGERVLNFTEGVVYIDLGNLPSGMSFYVTNSANNVITCTNLNDPLKLRLTIDRTSGLMRGSFFNSGTGKTNTVSGVVLRSIDQAYGFFHGTNRVGAVSIGAMGR